MVTIRARVKVKVRVRVRVRVRDDVRFKPGIRVRFGYDSNKGCS